MADGDAPAPTPELLNAEIDRRHRSFKTRVEGQVCPIVNARMPKERLTVDPRWTGRLHGAGLLAVTRLVQAPPRNVPRAQRAQRQRFHIDQSLMSALVDRWRPETHTFHLPCGEVAPTLQDVAFLLGLPLGGAAVGPEPVDAFWTEELEARFAGFQRLAGAAPVEPHPERLAGPSRHWLLQFQLEAMDPDAGGYSVSRCLEAFLFWLLGGVLLINSRGSTFDRVLIPYVRRIVDAPDDAHVPRWAWGPAVLAATYRGLCDACVSGAAKEPKLKGCPLLLQLWAYERIAVGRPLVAAAAYPDAWYGELDDDRPTMGTMWVLRPHTFAHVSGRREYHEFVRQLDTLDVKDVRWEPYSLPELYSRAPRGLASHCTANSALWLTKTPLVYDVCVEVHCPDRVMRQFGCQQPFPLDRVGEDRGVAANIHRLSRSGLPTDDNFGRILHDYVHDWQQRAERNLAIALCPHTEESYRAYLQWYQPRTRSRITTPALQQEPRQPTAQDTYPRHRDQQFAGALHQFNILIHDLTTQSMRAHAQSGPQWAQMATNLDHIKHGLVEVGSAFGSWVPPLPPPPPPEASHWSSQASTSYQFGSTSHCPEQGAAAAEGVAGLEPFGFPGTQHTTGFGDVPQHFTQPPWSEPSASQPGFHGADYGGPSGSTHPCADYGGPSGSAHPCGDPSDPAEDAADLSGSVEEMGIEDLAFLGDLTADPRPLPVTIEDMYRAVGAQVQETATPPPETQLPPREIREPDRFTYSADQVRAQQRAKRGRRGRGG